MVHVVEDVVAGAPDHREAGPGLGLGRTGEGVEEVRPRTSPGDRVFVPPFVPHREENPDPAEEA